MNSGFNFEKLKTNGISYEKFSEQIMASGLICNPNFHWIVFHGSYDFGYCMKLLSGEFLPQTVSDFFKTLKLYFPKIHDIKHITS
jgi:CCR4-NOT transcription complex subunit 7/8